MRTIITIYRTLYKYVCAVDAEYAASLSSPTSPSDSSPGTNSHPLESPSIDPHFRSGVYLGAGMSTLILSLLPARLLNIIELFGYAADRAEALEILGRAGGWGKPRPANTHKFTTDPTTTDAAEAAEAEAEPTVSTEQEGVRRGICDMALLIFHLVLSSFTFDGVDVQMAARIVKWNLKRYPDGAFISPLLFYLSRPVFLSGSIFCFGA